MGSPRVERAAEIVAELTEALIEAGLTKAVATLDGYKIPSGARHGVIIVQPPSLRLPTFTQVDATWSLVVVAGPADNYLAAWAVVDEIIEALIEANVAIDTADPASYQFTSGPALPAYELTLTETR